VVKAARHAYRLFVVAEETNGGSDSASSTVHMLNTGSGGATMETALMSYGAVENKLR
jgi:hypothetical protein